MIKTMARILIRALYTFNRQPYLILDIYQGDLSVTFAFISSKKPGLVNSHIHAHRVAIRTSVECRTPQKLYYSGDLYSGIPHGGNPEYKNHLKERTPMLSLTESATAKLTEYFQDKAITPLRIFYNAGG